jgi:hypothetical protein
VNGHEHARTDELQYACVFDLDEPRDCNAVTEPADGVDKRCSCRLPADGAPHCDPQEATRQLRGRVYPGLRQIEVVRGLDHQGGLGSSCPAQTSDPSAADFAYRPALRLLTEDLLASLAGQCLPRSLALDQGGQVACLVIEARRAGDEGCKCSDGRVAVSPEHAPMVDGIREHELQQHAQWDCFCEVPQLEGAAQSACREDLSDAPLSTDGSPVDGFCYVDASTSPPVGNPELVSQCPDAQRRRLRFVGQGEIAPGATVFMMCCT